MRVMGIDLSTKAGVAVVDHTGKLLHAGVVTHPKLTGLPRVNAIVGDILAIRDQYKPDHIFIEDYALGINMGSVITQVEISTVLQFCLWQEGVQPHLVHPSTLKKFVTGAGGSKKEMVILEVFKRWGHSAASNDEADAVALAFFGLARWGHAANCTSTMNLIVEQWVLSQQPKKPSAAKGSKKKSLASA
jgi:Holliday junction resolvasome RuvABC endonuclease subunit